MTWKPITAFVAVVGFILIPLFASAAGAVVREVLFDPTGTDTGSERITIYNPGNSVEDLSGWQLYSDSAGYFIFPAGFRLGSKASATIHLRASGADTALDIYDSEAGSNMGNTAGSVALFSLGARGKDTMKSFVQWGRAGERWESTASDIGLWTKGTFVDINGIQEGKSIVLRDPDRTATGKGDWMIGGIIAVVTTQSSGATGASDVSSSNTSSHSSSYASSVMPLAQAPSIRALAGEDRTLTAGSEEVFRASAIGLVKEPIVNARFWWNFGDGGTREGKSVGHTFMIPGTYIVALHVSSGDYAASDYLTVVVVANKIGIGTVIGGEGGAVGIHNGGEIAVDISGWSIEDDKGVRFFVPPDTRIAPSAEIPFANRITGLRPTSGAFLKYPDGSLSGMGNIVQRSLGSSQDEILLTQPLSQKVALASGSSAPKTVTEEKRSVRSASLGPDRAASSSSSFLETASLGMARGSRIGGGGMMLIAALLLSMLGAVGFLVLKRFIA